MIHLTVEQILGISTIMFSMVAVFVALKSEIIRQEQKIQHLKEEVNQLKVDAELDRNENQAHFDKIYSKVNTVDKHVVEIKAILTQKLS